MLEEIFDCTLKKYSSIGNKKYYIDLLPTSFTTCLSSWEFLVILPDETVVFA